MRYCGIHVSDEPEGQQLCTLHGRRGADGLELVTSFYASGTVEQVTRTVSGFGRGEAIVAVGAPAHPGAGRGELRTRGIPARSLGPDGSAFFNALSDLGRYRPQTANGARTGSVDASATRSGRVFETDPDVVFCALLGHVAPPRGTPWGGQQRIAALKLKGLVDDDGGLWHRTGEELDAAGAAYAAYALSAGLGTWVGDPVEGVLVVPTASLLDHYDALPAPARARLA